MDSVFLTFLMLALLGSNLSNFVASYYSLNPISHLTSYTLSVVILYSFVDIVNCTVIESVDFSKTQYVNTGVSGQPLDVRCFVIST